MTLIFEQGANTILFTQNKHSSNFIRNLYILKLDGFWHEVRRIYEDFSLDFWPSIRS